MKVLFQSVDRYQESVPSFKQYEVEGDCLNEEVVLKLMSDFYEDFYEDEITEFGKYQELSKSDKCWCVWGEETDVIVTVL